MLLMYHHSCNVSSSFLKRESELFFLSLSVSIKSSANCVHCSLADFSTWPFREKLSVSNKTKKTERNNLWRDHWWLSSSRVQGERTAARAGEKARRNSVSKKLIIEFASRVYEKVTKRRERLISARVICVFVGEQNVSLCFRGGGWWVKKNTLIQAGAMNRWRKAPRLLSNLWDNERWRADRESSLDVSFFFQFGMIINHNFKLNKIKWLITFIFLVSGKIYKRSDHFELIENLSKYKSSFCSKINPETTAQKDSERRQI